MALTFTVTVKGKIEDVLADVKAEAAKKEVKFEGDAKKGSFEGKGVKGTYTVKGQDITITITDKPFYAPESAVKDAITKFFAGK